MTTILQELASAHRAGKQLGITSVCSAHPLVIRAALLRGKKTGRPVLIEATCNQVNQFGGYTGMQPQDFADFVHDIAREVGFDSAQLILGGDHLGPNPWRNEPAEVALSKAEGMMAAFVKAGFSKIHLDASMGCAGEPPALDDHATATRAARLARVAEDKARAHGLPLPLYIIGTEVPVPGGETHAIAELQPTSAAAAQETIAVHKAIFAEQGLSDVLTRVIGVVVQPGVEFGNANVIAYRPELARDLSAVLSDHDGLVFEAHSTDYQTVEALAQLVRDGYPILKVGPGLTFALRQALYGLDLIASELEPAYGQRRLKATMEAIMLASPKHWQGHYHGSDAELHLQRHYSYSDRIRYYWTVPEAMTAVDHLFETLRGKDIPEPLLRQFVPGLAWTGNPEALVMAAVDVVLGEYDGAC